LPFTNSRTTAERAAELMPGAVNSSSRQFPGLSQHYSTPTLYITSGDGCTVQDLDGTTYLDYHMCAGAALFGHTNSRVISAIESQIASGICFASSHQLETEVGDLVRQLMPSLERVRFCNSGSEAVYAAIGVARTFSGKPELICFDGCYHGWIALRNDPHVTKLPLSDLDLVRAHFQSHAGAIAAVLIEPIPASNGLIILEDIYLRELRELCTEHSALLIFDEVISGMRVAPGGAQEILGVTPDLTILGKVLSGGMPVGVYGGRSEIMNSLAPIGTYYQGGTFSAHPLSLSAAKAVLTQISQHPPYQQLESISAHLQRELKKIANDAQINISVPRVASILSIYAGATVPNTATKRQKSMLPNYDQFHTALLEQGVFIQPQVSKWFLSVAHDMHIIHSTADAFRSALRHAF
jgi:glutamate-1-semialdehyde 2,1-aminomutase